MKFNKSLLTAALLAVGSLTAISANADTKTGSFDVKLDITKTCNVTAVVGTQDITFGSRIAGATVPEASQTTPISVNCSKGTAYNIGLLGTGVMTRTAAPLDTVAYTLLKATGGATWGNTGSEVGGTGTGMKPAQAKTHTVFASLAAGATDDLTPGSYKDTVVVTVTY